MRLDQMLVLGGVGAKVEEVLSSFASTGDDELVAGAEHGTCAGEILFLHFRMLEVLEIARGELPGAEFRQRSRALLQFRIYIGSTVGGGLPLPAAIPKPYRARSL